MTTDVKVRDLRDGGRQPVFKRDGIEFILEPSAIKEFENGDEWQATYDQELVGLLNARSGAAEVIVFDHTVRIDDPNALRRPARNVHNDYNEAGAEQRLVDLVGHEEAEAFKRSGYGFVNVWRPVEKVISSSPLGFIHPNSMKADDWMDIGLIYPDRFGQILGVAANQSHEWFFKSQMSPNDAVIFNIYDSSGRAHFAHSALDLPTDTNATSPRKSIESRSLVRYS